MTQPKKRSSADGPFDDHPESGQFSAASRVRLQAQPEGALDEAFASALRAVRDAPEVFGLWDRLEELCNALQTPEPVADAYLRMLTPARVDAVRDELGHRAVAFHDSWFGDDPAAIRRVLERVLEVCPDATWAFDRLVSVLTTSERWDDLLEVYDRALSGRLSPARLRQLLDDAAHVAKDFTDHPERALGYVRELLRIEPGAHALCASLERVLSERKAWQDLIRLWQAQIDATPETSLIDLRVRIARVYLRELHAPREALAEAENVLTRRPGDDQACALLESVLALDAAEIPLRLRSLTLLRLHHDSADRPLATIAALERALSFAPESEQIPLRRELASRLMAQREDAAALGHYAEVLRRAPDDNDARAQLSRLAERSGDHAAHAQALIAAASERCQDSVRAPLLLAAMHIHTQRLSARDAAIALGQQVLTLRGAAPADLRCAAEELERLLRGTGRDGEQLAVLRQLQRSEESPYRRRLLTADIAKLCDALSDPEGALDTWQGWLKEDPNDVEALGAAIAIAKHLARHTLEVELLRRRAEVAETQQRRQDLKRVATLQATELRDLGAAIETWLSIRAELGDDADLLAALDALMSESARFGELARIFETATALERERSLSRLCRLGDVHRTELDDPAAAARAYARALALDPACPEARSGLTALLGVKSSAQEVTAALTRAYRATDDWQLQIELLDARVAATEDPAEQAKHMLEVAVLCETRAKAPARAHFLVAKALPLLPFDAQAERELLRLTDATGHLREGASALHLAAQAASHEPVRAGELFALEGRLLEQLDDAKGAAEAFARALANRPNTPYETEALVRSSARAGEYRLACETALSACAHRGFADTRLFESLASAATKAGAYPTLCAELAQALSGRSNLVPAIACAIELVLSDWCLSQASDAAGAERAAKRALSLEPHNPKALRALANVQRITPGQTLLDTLLLLDERSPDSLDALVEAAQWLAQLDVDADRQRAVLTRLYRRAAELWTRTESNADAERWVLFSLERLVPLELQADAPDRALYLLDDAMRLPITNEKRAELRLESARILERQGQLAEALHLGYAVLAERGDDIELVRFLADIARRLERIADELILRKRQLALCPDVEGRLQLRLEVSRLTGLVEERDARLSMLRANLGEKPGHSASLEEACALLTEKHRLLELLTLLSTQAQAVTEVGEHALAIELWKRAAVLAEDRLHDHERAIFSLEQIALFHEEAYVFDQLVRLCRAIDDPSRTARWLSRRLAIANASERPVFLLELAKTQLLAHDVEAALSTLHTAFDEDPCDLAVRALLIEHLRAKGQRAELAAVLARAASETRDSVESGLLALEAARLYHAPLDNPGALVAVANLALGLRPDDAELCGMLADGLRALERFDEARQVLTYLLAQYGRRRSPERAAVHAKLAEVLRDEGDLAGSCAQLELALSMRADDVSIMHALAERAAEASDLVRRERALRGLLLAAKRGPVVIDSGRTLGASELLFELSEVSRARGDVDQANKLRESALEALRLGDPECERIKQRLRESGSEQLLEQIMRQQLTHAITSAERVAAMGALSELLATRPEGRDEALELRLAAVELDPGDPSLHDAAQASCTKNELPRFRALLERLRERARRPSDTYARCEVCLRLADLHFAEGEIDRAASLLTEAENTGVRESDVLRAQLRLAAARGDTSGQALLLSKLGELGGAELADDERAEVIYRLAELRLTSDVTRKEGVARMREALVEAPRPVRAARILLRAWSEQGHDPELAAMFADVAPACRKEQLTHIADLCIKAGAPTILGTLIECALPSELTPDVRATLLVKRAELLIAENKNSREAVALLKEASTLSPEQTDAETLLLSCLAECGEPEQLVTHVRSRFQRALALGDLDGCTRYALLLHRHAREADAADVIAILRETAELAPSHGELHAALLARLTPQEHAYDRAEVLERIIAQGDADADALPALASEAAELYETCGEGVSAVRVLRRARAVCKEHTGLAQQLCELFRRQDDIASLAELLAERARMAGDAKQRASALQEAASLQRTRREDHASAAALLEEAVSFVPDDTSLRRELATDLLTLGRVDAAAEQLKQAALHCAQDSQRGELLFMRGRALLEHGKHAEGILDLKQAFALASGDVATDLLETLEAARQRAHLAQQQDDEHALTLCMASMRRALSDLPEATRLLEAFTARVPPTAEDLQLLVELYMELDWQEDLARTLARLIPLASAELRPKYASRLLVLVSELDDLGALRSALDEAYGTHPEVQDLENALIATMTSASDYLGIARLLMNRAQRASDEHGRAQALSRAAQHFLQGGALREATEVLEKLHAQAPLDLDTAATLADTLIQQGRLPEARALLERLVDPRAEGQSASRARLLLRFAEVTKALGDNDLALAAMQAARDADPSNRTILGRLAVLAEELGAWAVAENTLASLLLLKGPEVMPRSELLLRRARVAVHHGGTRRALLWARKALEAAQDSEDAARLVAQLEAELG